MNPSSFLDRYRSWSLAKCCENCENRLLTEIASSHENRELDIQSRYIDPDLSSLQPQNIHHRARAQNCINSHLMKWISNKHKAPLSRHSIFIVDVPAKPQIYGLWIKLLVSVIDMRTVAANLLTQLCEADFRATRNAFKHEKCRKMRDGFDESKCWYDCHAEPTPTQFRLIITMI